MSKPRKYPPELKKRAVRLVVELQSENESLSRHGAVKQIAQRVGVHKDTLRSWCKQAEIDEGKVPGTTTAEAAKIKELEREVKELKRANEILLAASSFFARELDPRLPW